jgi:Ca2+-binding RTX toxin-like protein
VRVVHHASTHSAAPQPVAAAAPQPVAAAATEPSLADAPASLHPIVGSSGDERLAGGSEADLIVAGTGNDTLVGGTGNDTFIAGPGHNQIWAYTDGYGGHPMPGWDPGAETFAFGFKGTTMSGVDTVHTIDPAHNDVLRFVDTAHQVTSVAALDHEVTVSNGPAADFAHRGDVTIQFKDGSGGVTLANFFNVDNPLHEVHSLQDLSHYIHVEVSQGWFF